MTGQMLELDQEVLDEIVRRIVQVAAPEKIIMLHCRRQRQKSC